MKIIITGGNGYVGRVLTRSLMDAHEVCVIDNLRYGEDRFSAAESQRFRKEIIDIRNSEDVARVLTEFQPEAIIHLAAIHYIPECETIPGLAASINVEGTVNLLHSCPAGCRFVFASSGAVYAPENEPHKEDSSQKDPQDVYGYTKLHGEHYIHYFSKLRGFPAVIVRLFNVVGPGETNPHLLPEIFAQLKAGAKSLKLGNLTSMRDYIDVNDAAAGFWAAASQGKIENGTQVTANLGTGIMYSVQEILERIRVLGGIDFEILQEADRIRKVDRPYLSADTTRIKELFKWSPSHTMDSTIKSMLDNPDLPNSLIAKYLQ